MPEDKVECEWDPALHHGRQEIVKSLKIDESQYDLSIDGSKMSK